MGRGIDGGEGAESGGWCDTHLRKLMDSIIISACTSNFKYTFDLIIALNLST